MNTLRQSILAVAAVLGFAGVLFAAAGSHWVDGLDDPGRYRQWQAAVLVNLVHAPALLAMASLSNVHRHLLALSALLIAGGVALFSGTIYFAMITGGTGPGPAAPVGGMGLLLGWVLLFVAGFGKPGHPESPSS
ncbi:MAG: DUF423 domain-containing protein [Xanthomonadales bacterium]|nr:DUF423 domain-containing protein [Xanthomonadales bacterium]NNL96049.1 DUF423 domain-containing protein [Xanthomonadales bacterium]